MAISDLYSSGKHKQEIGHFASVVKIAKSDGIIEENEQKLLDKTAKKVGANLSKVKKDIKSTKVNKLLAMDLAEAQKFGFNGTPGFLVNGVSINGAYPFPYFKQIIDRHLKN
mgnify:CR=1 FL=1